MAILFSKLQVCSNINTLAVISIFPHIALYLLYVLHLPDQKSLSIALQKSVNLHIEPICKSHMHVYVLSF